MAHFSCGLCGPINAHGYHAAPAGRSCIHLPHICIDRVMSLICLYLWKPWYVADLNQVNSTGRTALQLADSAGRVAVSMLLRENGAA